MYIKYIYFKVCENKFYEVLFSYIVIVITFHSRISPKNSSGDAGHRFTECFGLLIPPFGIFQQIGK